MSVLRALTLVPLLALVEPAAGAATVACTAGVAAGHACHRIDLEARLDTATLGYGNLNDVWGWTDPLDGREYALVGAERGTVFVDITDPAAPRIVGRLPAHEDIVAPAGPTKGAPKAMCKPDLAPRMQHSECEEGASTWRNIKVHADHAYVGSESSGHGVQVFDLTELRAFPPGSAVQEFDETAHYAGFGHSHTLYIDEASGFLYGVGSDTYSGGLHFVDLSAPAAPVAAGGYGGDGYTHEVQCEVYAGPDAAHVGRQICFASNEDTLTIVDVTNKGAPVRLSRTGYPQVGYTHQGWLTADHRYFFMNDELDELGTGGRLRTLVWDLLDLEAPVLVDEVRQPRFSIDHNNYVHQGFVFQSNYTSGLVVLDGRVPTAAFEVAFFDTHPAGDGAVFDGTWSNYPFFASGVVAVSDITRGLYLLRPQLGGAASDARQTLGTTLGEVPGQPGGVVTPGIAGGTFTVSVGRNAEIRIFATGSAPGGPSVIGHPGPCEHLGRRVVRCQISDPSQFQWSIAVRAVGGSAVRTEIVAMVASGGLESAPGDNRLSLVVDAPGNGDDGGGGAPDGLLLLGLALAGAARRGLRTRSTA